MVGDFKVAGRLLRLGLLAGSALIAAPALAQTATKITPDAAGSALSLGTTAVRAGHVTTIGGGTLAGTNLFHSFSTFDLAAGETARWTSTLTDPARLTNVMNRVTGGAVSAIDGTLDSNNMPRAELFFINPATRCWHDSNRRYGWRKRSFYPDSCKRACEDARNPDLSR